MIKELEELLLTGANLFYLLTVLLAPVVVKLFFLFSDLRRHRRRAAAGLPAEELVGPERYIDRQRRRAFIEAASVFGAIFLFPLFAAIMPGSVATIASFKLSFPLMIIGFSIAASEVIRSYVSGLLFFSCITAAKGMQVGDRVTLLGHSGRVDRMSPLFVELVTPNDDRVTLPTAKLWSEPVVSANSGSRSSLCLMSFHFSPFVTSEQRVLAEDSIWEAIHSSVYVDLGRQVQILCHQDPSAIRIDAKAYVASTYQEFEFKSDVTARVLAACQAGKIPIGIGEWRSE